MMGVREISKNYERGLEFYDQGLLIDALAAFEAVLKEASPNSPEAKLAKFYIVETHAGLAEEDVSRGALDRATAHLKEAISRNPKYPDLHFQLAGVLAERGSPRDAAAELRIALKLNSGYAKAMLMLGILCYEVGDYAHGLAHVVGAAELEPRYVTPLYHEVLDAHEKKDHRRAFAQLRELAMTNVDDISFHFGVGKKLYRSGDYEGAVEAFEQALSLQSAYPDIRNWMGLALMARREPEKALEHFQKALEINPTYIGAMINAGVACEMMGLKADARDFYSKALDVDPDDIEARERLANLGQ